ncbi:MAG: GNAT family N-acetyltransferase [Bacillota bacterium]
MQTIIELTAGSPYLDEAVKMIWTQWGDEHNFNFFQDMVLYSCSPGTTLPKFYICLQNEDIVGTCALLRYDLVSRQDLSPWLACLYVVPGERVRGIGTALQEHVVREAKRKGFDRIFLCTELEGYYERSNWRQIGRGYLYTGQAVKIYEKA